MPMQIDDLHSHKPRWPAWAMFAGGDVGDGGLRTTDDVGDAHLGPTSALQFHNEILERGHAARISDSRSFDNRSAYATHYQNFDMGEESEDLVTFGGRLRAARRQRGWSQKALASAAGIAQPTISDIERGKQIASVYVVQLARSLGVNSNWLNDGRGPRYPGDRTRAHAQTAEDPTWPFSVPWARYAALKQAQKDDLDGLVAYQIGVYERKNRIFGDEAPASELVHVPARDTAGEPELMEAPYREHSKRSGE